MDPRPGTRRRRTLGPRRREADRWDLKTGKEVARYEFSDADSDKKCSFLNDVAVDNDSGLVHISDSGIFCNPLKGGILVYDIKANKAKRVLSAPEWVDNENFALSIA